MAAEPDRRAKILSTTNLTSERPDKSWENRIRYGNSIVCRSSHAGAATARVKESGSYLSSVLGVALWTRLRAGCSRVYVLIAALRAAFSNAYVGVRSV